MRRLLCSRGLGRLLGAVLGVTAASPALAVTLTKSFLNDPVQPGATVTLQFTLTNPDNFGRGDLSFSDDLTAVLNGLAATGTPLADICGNGSSLSGTTVLSFTGGVLPALGSCSFSVVLQVPTNAAPGTYTNVTTGVFQPGEVGLDQVGNPAQDTLTVGDTPQQTGQQIGNFLDRRADRIVSADPNLTFRLTGQNGDSPPLNFSATASGSSVAAAFSTSLGRMLSAGAGDNSAGGRQDGLLAYGDQGASATAARPRFDIWASGYLSRFKDDTGNGGQAGNFALLFTGADYIVGNLAIGVMAQIDRVKESSGTLGTKASGTGWMVGPYAVAQVHRNLFVQARAAWGRSDNDFTVVGASTGNYDGERWLLSSQIEGRWYAGRWRFSPIATIVYFEEKQEAFVNSLSQAIPGQSVALGRLTFGPEIGYSFVTSAGTIFEPHVALSGVWDFKETAQVVNGQTFSPDELSANLAAGVIVRTRGGTALRSILTYEGIGDGDFQAVSGTVLITVPF